MTPGSQCLCRHEYDSLQAGGPFLETPGNLSGPKSNSWNPVAVKSYSFNMFQIQGKAKLMSSFKAWNLLLWKIQKSSCDPKSFETFEKRATGSSVEITRGRKYRSLVTSFETVHQVPIFWLRVISLLAGCDNISLYLLMVCSPIIKDKPKTELIAKGNTKTTSLFNCHVF